ncbi:unnamed protein product [Adineta steineri]|uniref:Uncharacterized protein n=1 Tax=Adineta steineri TaxID=433720 RepID=A0A818PEC3_9BILA|nr:unnamed protein product [Adineta steineri]CAF3617775.1 unnamed protein product [Adineta steineri]
MIQVHVDLLQNLQQAVVVFNMPFGVDCGIQTNQVIFENEDQHWKTVLHFNDLIIDINKSIETSLTETNVNSNEKEQIRRTFKFPFLRLPKITDNVQHDFTNIKCAKCQSTLKLIPEDRPFKIVQQQNTNVDDINEVIYCHRFCEAHQHEHKHDYNEQVQAPLNLHTELIVLETTECFIIAKEFITSTLINNELVQCNHCSSHLGSFDVQKNLISFDKCSLIPFSNDYLLSCFHHHEPGRYIVKVPKFNDSILLVWILPNEILSADTSISSINESTQLIFHRKRKVLFTHITSSDNNIFNEWKRDFSVTTLLVNRLCLDHLSTAFQQELQKFPNVFNKQESFQSLTISF